MVVPQKILLPSGPDHSGVGRWFGPGYKGFVSSIFAGFSFQVLYDIRIRTIMDTLTQTLEFPTILLTAALGSRCGEAQSFDSP